MYTLVMFPCLPTTWDWTNSLLSPLGLVTLSIVTQHNTTTVTTHTLALPSTVSKPCHGVSQYHMTVYGVGGWLTI